MTPTFPCTTTCNPRTSSLRSDTSNSFPSLRHSRVRGKACERGAWLDSFGEILQLQREGQRNRVRRFKMYVRADTYPEPHSFSNVFVGPMPCSTGRGIRQAQSSGGLLALCCRNQIKHLQQTRTTPSTPTTPNQKGRNSPVASERI